MRKTIYGSLLLLFICSCKKDTPKDPLENTIKLAGNHSWEGIKTALKIINNGTDTIVESEEPVLYEQYITVVSNNIIYFPYDTMYVASVNKINKTIMYISEDNYMYPFRYSRDTIIYNYSNSFIEFRHVARSDNTIYKLNLFSLK
jgi:hypothetical protein